MNVAKLPASELMKLLSLPTTFDEEYLNLASVPDDSTRMIMWCKTASNSPTSSAQLTAHCIIDGQMIEGSLAVSVKDLRSFVGTMNSKSQVSIDFNVKSHTPAALTDLASLEGMHSTKMITHVAGSVESVTTYDCIYDSKNPPEFKTNKDMVSVPNTNLYIHSQTGDLVIVHGCGQPWNFDTELPYVNEEQVKQVLKQLMFDEDYPATICLPTTETNNKEIQIMTTELDANITTDSTINNPTNTNSTSNTEAEKLQIPLAEGAPEEPGKAQRKRRTKALDPVPPETVQPAGQPQVEGAVQKGSRASSDEVDQRAIDRLTARGYIVTKPVAEEAKDMSMRLSDIVKRLQELTGEVQACNKELKTAKKNELTFDNLSLPELVTLSGKIAGLLAKKL